MTLQQHEIRAEGSFSKNDLNCEAWKSPFCTHSSSVSLRPDLFISIQFVHFLMRFTFSGLFLPPVTSPPPIQNHWQDIVGIRFARLVTFARMLISQTGRACCILPPPASIPSLHHTDAPLPSAEGPKSPPGAGCIEIWHRASEQPQPRIGGRQIQGYLPYCSILCPISTGKL